jgi:N-acetylmuramoyl-L-alanine amidase
MKNRPSLHIAGLLPALIMVLLLAAAGQAEETPARVIVDGEDRPLAAFQRKDITYISLSELSKILGGRMTWKVVGHEIVYEVEQHSFEFLIASPFFKSGDKVYNLTFPAELRQGELYVPAETFAPFLDGAVSPSVTFYKPSASLTIDSEHHNVISLNLEEKANGLLIELLLTKELLYEVYVTEGNWLNITINNARIDVPRILSAKDSRYVYKLTAHQSAGSGQVSMRLKRNVEKWRHKLAFNPPRIQIIVQDVDFSLDPVDTAPVAVGPDDKIDVIVIDPGHGGSDYGAIGPHGSREKDIVLSISRELAKLLRADKQFKVIMTRDRDKYVSLEDRAAVANDAGADLYISVHANASASRRPRGWNVFFLAPAKNDSARAVAQFENSVFMQELSQQSSASPADPTGDEDPILTILNEMIMTEFQEESHDFAMMIAREFTRHLDIPARGVDQAAFFVLNGVFTPSVLIESGFISNRNEEKVLNTSNHQKSLARAIYNAIKQFKAKYEKS